MKSVTMKCHVLGNLLFIAILVAFVGWSYGVSATMSRVWFVVFAIGMSGNLFWVARLAYWKAISDSNLDSVGRERRIVKENERALLYEKEKLQAVIKDLENKLAGK